MPLLVFLVLFVILKLMHATVDSFNRIDREEVQNVILVFLDSHCERLFKHEVQSVWLLNEFDAAVRTILLHSEDQILSLLSGIFDFIIVEFFGLERTIASFCSFLLTFSEFLSLNVNSSDGF